MLVLSRRFGPTAWAVLAALCVQRAPGCATPDLWHVTAAELSHNVRAFIGGGANSGALLHGRSALLVDVKQGSFAEDVGLNRGDVILEVNKQAVNGPDDFTKIESSLKSGQDVVFLVRPRGSRAQDGTIFLAGTLP